MTADKSLTVERGSGVQVEGWQGMSSIITEEKAKNKGQAVGSSISW